MFAISLQGSFSRATIPPLWLVQMSSFPSLCLIYRSLSVHRWTCTLSILCWSRSFTPSIACHPCIRPSILDLFEPIIFYHSYRSLGLFSGSFWPISRGSMHMSLLLSGAFSLLFFEIMIKIALSQRGAKCRHLKMVNACGVIL